MVADDNNEAFNSMAPAGAVCDWSCENNLRLGMPTPVLLVYRNFWNRHKKEKMFWSNPFVLSFI